ncbi:hypothetical protein PA01_09675 [Azoarcus sp. PA01]|nr:hypothetical protein PA01_09675 [Azoarcus sp. PA01]
MPAPFVLPQLTGWNRRRHRLPDVQRAFPSCVSAQPGFVRRLRRDLPRALALRMLLILALALVQTGALMHVIGHAGTAATGGTTLAAGDGDDSERAPFCHDCLALGGIDLSLASSAGPSGDAGAACSPPDGGNAITIRSDRLPPRCRAPPRTA